MAISACRIHLLRRVVLSRWFIIYASILIMSASGATYIFGIYSPYLKSSLHYNQHTLNTLSFFKDLGANVGILSGLINEVTPPFVVLLIGAAMNLVGYLLIYLATTYRISRPPVWQLCLFICAAANSQTFANTGGLVTCVKNFPESRGIVLGLLKCFVGLSGAIFSQLYLAFYGEDSASLILLIAWLPAVISIVFVYTIRIMEPPRGSDLIKTRPFYHFLYLTIFLAAYLLVIIIIEKFADFNRAEHIANGGVIFFLLFLPVIVVINEEIKSIKFESEQRDQGYSKTEDVIAGAPSIDTNVKFQSFEDSQQPARDENFSKSAIFRRPARGDDYSILQALFSIDMFVLFFATIFGAGGTLTAIDNMGQIGQSLGYPSRSINTFVSLISIWNAMGRLSSGFLSEILLKKYKFPRPLMLTLVLILACAGHLLIAFGVSNSLYIASVIIGFCFGAQWPLLYAIISEIFGLKYYSTLYNFGGVASPVGSYILNVMVAGKLYDREAERQSTAVGFAGENNDLLCVGVKCFQLSFLIITAATVLGAAVSLILVFRTRKFYKGDIYAKFRNETEIPEIMAPETAGSGGGVGRS